MDLIIKILIAIGGIGGIAAVLNAILGFKKLSKETKEFKLSTLREAFLMEKNDIYSRRNAWQDYKKLGGENFDNYYAQALKENNA